MWTEPLYTAEEMRAAEQAHDGPMLELMERAGSAAADSVLRRYPAARSVAVWCGTGANGGDGFVVARKLHEAGRAVEIVLVGSEDNIAGDAEENLELARKLKIPFTEPGGGEVAVDALFGTGFSGKPRDEAARAIEELNGLGVPIVAVDVPSGVDASTGQVTGAAVNADATVTFHGRKVGLMVAPGRFHAGEVEVADIAQPNATRAGHRGDSRRGSTPRAGRQQVHGGIGPGRRRLDGEDGGAVPGRRSCASRGSGDRDRLRARLPEPRLRAAPAGGDDEDGVMTMDAADAILEGAEKATAVAIGPGIGRTDAVRALVGYLLDRLDKPIVLDADGLWCVAGHLDWVFSRDARTVLTPHAGELARLLGRDSSAVSARRLNAVQSGADDVGAVVLLKGADTLVASPGKGILVSDLGNPGLATAGTGDVLTGIVAAFLSKGMDGKVAAAAAAAAGGEAARLASETHGTAGMIASDVVEALSPILSR